MSDRRPIIRVTFKRGDQNYSVLSVWRGRFPGTYSVNRDKGTEKYPAISLVDVIKAFASGDGFVNVSVESERDQRGGEQRNQPRRTEPADEFGDDSDIPF
jgi:hypothetical protein